MCERHVDTTPQNFAHLAHAYPSAGMRSSPGKPGADLSRPAEALDPRRDHPGMAGEIISERWARSSRNGGRLHSGIRERLHSGIRGLLHIFFAHRTLVFTIARSLSLRRKEATTRSGNDATGQREIATLSHRRKTDCLTFSAKLKATPTHSRTVTISEAKQSELWARGPWRADTRYGCGREQSNASRWPTT